jgi:non-ribosomal peptide synthetase component F
VTTAPPPALASVRSPLLLTAEAAGRLTLDAMFARVATRRPDHTAVRVGSARLTYRGAEHRARQLASLLVRGGVQLGDPVVVSCGDHRRSLVAQLAVLKAGGVCLPIPAHTPEEVSLRLLGLSGARTVLCGGAHPPAWAGAAARVVALDDLATWQRAEAVAPDASLPRSSPVDPAYLLPVRGSVAAAELIDHHAWQTAAAARIQRVGAADHGVEIRQAACGPVALAALWWAVASAGTLFCAPADAPLTRSPAAVLDVQEYDRLLAAGAAGPRTVVLLGDPCPEALAARHRRLLPASRLWTEFAPSGGALPWTARRWSRTPSDDGTSTGRRHGSDVGSPVTGVRVEILDERGRATPGSGTGEVCAVGPALAYDRLTAEADQGAHTPWPAAPVLHSAVRGYRYGGDRVAVLAGRPG